MQQPGWLTCSLLCETGGAAVGMIHLFADGRCSRVSLSDTIKQHEPTGVENYWRSTRDGYYEVGLTAIATPKKQ